MAKSEVLNENFISSAIFEAGYYHSQTNVPNNNIFIGYSTPSVTVYTNAQAMTWFKHIAAAIGKPMVNLLRNRPSCD